MAQAVAQAEVRRALAKPADLKKYLVRHRAELVERMRAGGEAGISLARRHAQIADELARGLFQRASERCTEVSVLLGAVGGYGRGLLALSSDLDLCFVTDSPPEQVADCVEAVLYPLWDAGISVGHQVVWTQHLATDVSSDLFIATELLDFRPLAGDLRLADEVKARLSESLFSEQCIGDFIARLEAEARRRHAQFGDSVYLLEPDLKRGMGGLRDLDMALWVARARFDTSDFSELAQLGVIGAQAALDVERALEFMWTVRNHLHQVRGRKLDRLTFGEQEQVAQAMGYEPSNAEGVPTLQRTGEMVERFMSDYYRHARAVQQARDRIIGRAKRRQGGPKPPVKWLDAGLVECGGRVGLAQPGQVLVEPALAFRVYAVAVARDMAILSHTRDAIVNATADSQFCERLRSSTEAAELFVALACVSRAAPFASESVLTELHDVGLLLAMIPEFLPVVGRVHHDLYHVYTVDVHSIAAVDRLHALARGELVASFPLASRLVAETARRRVLFLGTLLHDVGKAIGGRNHARRGADMAREILKRLRFAPEDVDDTCLLIRYHLAMYMVAVRRDLGEPGTIEEFVRDMPHRESLRELYLLTIADVSTTSKAAMTKWKSSMLDALFRASDAFMAGVLPGPTDRVNRVKQQARGLWPHSDALGAFEEFLESMPSRYFLANPPEQVVRHANLALQRADGSVGLSCAPGGDDGVLGLCVVAGAETEARVEVVARDRPGLLALIAAAISANGFDVQAAQINSRALGNGTLQAVDLFWVRGPEHGQRLNARLKVLEHDLERMIRGEIEPEALLRFGPKSWSEPASPAVATEVVFDHNASSSYTVIEVLTEDRRALLFTLACALRDLGITIGIAKISSEGKRAVDVFYAAEVDGSKIEPGPRTDRVRAELLAALGSAEPTTC